MAPTVDNPPLPGTWVRRAQDSLDALAAMVTIEEVADEFGTARTLAEAILGAPIAGGVATRRTIRATGRLLTHRLGPALAAEALSWAASVTEQVSTAAIEEFLEAAAGCEIVRRPLQLDDRHVLNEHLERCRTDPQRRAELAWWWQSRTDDVRWRPDPEDRPDDLFTDWLYRPLDDPPCWAVGAPPCSNPSHPLCWDQPEAGTDSEGPSRPTSIEVFAADNGGDQVQLFNHLETAERAAVASDWRLFDLDEAVIGRCLVEHTVAVLANPACPHGLRDRVRHPYDAATLELAVRSGPAHFEVARVRRLLDQIDEAEHCRFMKQLRLPYLKARQACGLNTVEALTTGRLA